MYSCHLFIISSASVRFSLLLSFILSTHLCMTCPLGISNFLEEIANLSNFAVFLYFFPLLLKKAFLSPFLFSGALRSVPFLPCLLCFFFSHLFVRPPQTATLPSCISFSLGWFWSLPSVWCYEHPSRVLQALSTRYNPLNLFVSSTV